MNVAYNMDCMEAMRQMPDKAFERQLKDVEDVTRQRKMHDLVIEYLSAQVGAKTEDKP